MMRVLSVLNCLPPAYSGATRSWFRLLPALANAGIQVDILGVKADGQVTLQTAEGRITSIARPVFARSGTYLGNLIAILTALWKTRKQYTCVMFVGGFDALFASLLIRFLLRQRIAYRMSMLGEDDPEGIRKSGRFGWLRFRLLRSIDAAICINPAMTSISERMGIDTKRIFTILQGTDTQFFCPPTVATKASIRTRIGLSQGAKIVTFCGIITHRKGLDLLVRAWQSVAAREPSARLLIVGPHGGAEDSQGTYLRTIEQMSLSPECGGSVMLLGYREDVRDILQASDIFAFPSRMEGTPNAVLEAMSVGLPCIVSDLPGISGTFVRPGVDGLVIPMEDWKALAAALCTLLAEECFAKELGTRARARAVEAFSIESVAQKYADVFATLNAL